MENKKIEKCVICDYTYWQEQTFHAGLRYGEKDKRFVYSQVDINVHTKNPLKPQYTIRLLYRQGMLRSRHELDLLIKIVAKNAKPIRLGKI